MHDMRVYSMFHIEGLSFDGDSMLMLILVCSSGTVWKWGGLLFQRNMLPPSSESKSVG